jgi:sulfite reductase (NADPH) flavoprotein alpha-component
MTGHSLKNPYLARVKKKTLLSDQDPHRRIFHLVLEIEDSDISYSCGDSAAIFPSNDPVFVEKLLTSLSSCKNHKILDPKTNIALSIEDFLLHKANISKISLPLLRAIAKENPSSFLHDLLQNKEKYHTFIQSHELWDFLFLLKDHHIPCDLITSHILPMIPRFYSIASSQKAHPNELHLLVAAISYFTSEHLRYGVATHFLCDLAKERETKIPIFIHKTPHFSLPQNPSTPIIMIGAGTGLAPFLGFLQERHFNKALGKNWLIFGERNQKNGFFQKEFLQKLEKEHFLHLSLAFSRDQKEKIYVQHKMKEEKKRLFAWLKEGAILYVCGDAKKMALDVDKTLHEIVREEGNMSTEEAKLFIKQLTAEKRYQKDIY